MTCGHGKEMHVCIKLYVLRVNCVTTQNMLSLAEIDYLAALSSNFLHNDLENMFTNLMYLSPLGIMTTSAYSLIFCVI